MRNGRSKNRNKKPNSAKPNASRTEEKDPSVDEDVVAPKPGADPRVALKKRCGRLGLQAALDGRHLEPDETTIKALEAEATAEAQTLARPLSAADEARKTKELARLDDQHQKRSAARDRAKAESQVANQKLAELGPSTAFPVLQLLLIQAVIIALAASIAPTAHDLAVGLDPFLRWIAGGATAWMISLVVVYGLMPLDQPVVESGRRNKAFYAGIGLGVALLLIRLSSATETAEMLFAIGLTVAEFSVVWFWERKTSQIEQARIAWHTAEEERSGRRSLAQAADENVDYRQRLVDETERKQRGFDAKCERDFLVSDPKLLTTIAINAVRGGYYRGVTFNSGLISGATGWMELSEDNDSEEEDQDNDDE